jgi:hypothetical protein
MLSSHLESAGRQKQKGGAGDSSLKKTSSQRLE